MSIPICRIALPLVMAGFSLTGFGQSAATKAPNGWHLTDQKSTGYYGISLDKAYQFLAGKKSTPTVVAVIDSGIDTTHEDLRRVLWTNPKEIAGNGIDDDNNGFVDDVHGWNFLGGKDGRNVKEDSYEAARVYHKYKAQFEGVTNAANLSAADAELYRMWTKSRRDVMKDVNPGQLLVLQQMLTPLLAGDSVIQKDLGKKEYNGNDLKAYTPTNPAAEKVKSLMMNISAGNNNYEITNAQLIEELQGEVRKGETVNKPPTNYRRDIVQDDEDNFSSRGYGNNDIMANTPLHGTHVSGIIAADRKNGKGVDGIADNVTIMTLRAVPDGDEHDKDIALAIRYAVDNGAKVVNMSFGKGVSPHKDWVDDAVRYAESKGVLLVHAAGNEAANIDTSWNFPSPVYVTNKQHATNWLSVGASGAEKKNLVANFSNYGKAEVDLFSPGVNIYATLPGGNTYGNLSGTSMASPVAAGVAALIMQYYPSLTGQQVKTILEKSAVPFTENITNPATKEKEPLSNLSRTGGVINAFEAIKMADALVNNGKVKTADTKVKIKGAGVKTKVKTPTVKMKEKVKPA